MKVGSLIFVSGICHNIWWILTVVGALPYCYILFTTLGVFEVLRMGVNIRGLPRYRGNECGPWFAY